MSTYPAQHSLPEDLSHFCQTHIFESMLKLISANVLRNAKFVEDYVSRTVLYNQSTS